MRIFFILGTAAELIKIYPLIAAVEARGGDYYVWNTGQSATSFWLQYDEFGLPRERSFCLDPMAADLRRRDRALKWFFRNLASSGRILRRRLIAHLGFLPAKGDWAFVHGDTLSTLLGAFFARRLGLKLVHIEAGMRSGHLFAPFPEEINRRLVSSLAHVHAAPDEKAAENLRREKQRGEILVSEGNTVIESLQMALAKPRPPQLPLASVHSPYVVANLHRFENLHQRTKWKKMIETLVVASRSAQVYFVMHPPTQEKLESDPQAQKLLREAGVHCLERLPYVSYIHLLAGAQFLLTDSGSNQQESAELGLPCLLLREQTESQEGLGENCVLSKFDDQIIENFLRHSGQYRHPALVRQESPSQRILKALGI